MGLLTITEAISRDEEKNNKIYKKAKHILESGGLVAFPTETVYGLGADALNPEACKKIYKAKGRPSDNPLIVHTYSAEAAQEVAVFDERAKSLAACFWPGPLTLVLKRRENVPDVVTGGLDTVAVRVPSHITARQFLTACDMFIAAPSANLSGHPSPTHSSHVIKDLEGRVDMIIADDSVNVGIESTILDLSTETPVILRPGVVTCEQIKAVLGEDVTFAEEACETEGPKAPGMKYRHYAPEAELFIVCGEASKKLSKIKEMSREYASGGKKVFILSETGNKDSYDVGQVIDLGTDVHTAAARLYGALRSCDAEGADIVLAEGFDSEGVGRALMNRLIKAAGNNIINV